MRRLLTRRLTIAMGLFSWLSASSLPARSEEKRFANVGELREYVMTILRRKPGVKSIEPDIGDPAVFHVVYGETTWTMDVTNIFGRLNAYPDEDVDNTIEYFLKLFGPTEARKISNGDVVVVIRSRDYVDYYDQKGVKVRCETVAGDLMAVFMVDLPNSMSPLIEGDMTETTPNELRAIALDNVMSWLPKVVSDDTLGVGSLFYVEGNTFLSTSLILLDDFWKSIEAKFPSDVLIALPRTDQLFVFDASNPNASEAAHRLIDLTFQDGFNLLSKRIYRRRNGELAIFVN